MSEAKYSVERDLKEAQAMADHLVPYIYEKELYGSVGGMFASGSMPRLTIGALLAHLHRLHAMQDRLTPAQKVQLTQIEARLADVRKEWTIHYNDKLIQEAGSRLKMIERFFDDCDDDPRTCGSNYPPEANRRTIVQVILNTLQQPNPDLERLAGKVDSRLRRYTVPGDFIWSPELAAVYPRDRFWWLYARPPRA